MFFEMVNENLEPEYQHDVTEQQNFLPGHNADVLEKVLSQVGEMGRYQKLLFVAMMPFAMTYACNYYLQLIITVTPHNHWCRVPELANLSVEMRRNLSAPSAISGAWDKCVTYDANWTQVLETLTPPSPKTNLLPCQHGWEFELSDIPYSTVSSEREWVCDRSSYVPTAQTVFFIGSMVGTIVFGWVADRFGRVPAIAGTNLLSVIGGIATTFTSGLWDFLLCRFIVGMSFDNSYMIVYILVFEYVGPQYRSVVANLSIGLFFGFASITIPWIAYYIADWRLLLWITSLPALAVLLVLRFLPESTRWLISRGRINEAVAVLKRIEAINGTSISDSVMSGFVIFADNAKMKKKESILKVLKSSPLRKGMISLMILYSLGVVILDGLVRLSDSFGMSFFVMLSGYAVSECLSAFLLAGILNRCGQKKLTCTSTVLCGICVLIAMFMTKGIHKAFLAIIGHFCIISCIMTLVQWSTELIPTPFRALVSSVIRVSAFCTSMVTPFIGYSERLWTMLPMLIFTATAFLMSSITLTLPETTGLPMPQTIADIENIMKGKSSTGNSKNIPEERQHN